jgi:DNA polymerase I-like protein with 3'-5' exonuclease and polymerase domains
MAEEKRIQDAKGRLLTLLRKGGGDEGLRSLLESDPAAVQAAARRDEARRKGMSNIEEAVASLTKAAAFSLDLETDGPSRAEATDPLRGKIVGVSFGVDFKPGSSWWFPFEGGAAAGEQVFSQVEVFRAVQPILLDPAKTLIGSNCKFDLMFLKMNGVEVRNRLFDTVVADWMMNENNRRHGLKEIVKREFDVELEKFTTAWASRDLVGGSRFSEYAVNDARYAFKLWRDVHMKFLEAKGSERLSKLFHSVEMEIVHIFMEAEMEGVCIDLAYIAALKERMETAKKEAADRAFSIMGRPFKISSPEEVSIILFGVPPEEALRSAMESRERRKPKAAKKDLVEKFNTKGLFGAPKGMFPVPLDRKGRSVLPGDNGFYSTDDSVLNGYDHPFVKALLDYRSASQTLKFFVYAYIGGDPDDPKKVGSVRDGRVYPDFHQAGTIAGRFCVSGDTVLETSVGICRISDLELPNNQQVSIITHRGQPRRILGKYYLGREEMFRVVLDNGSSIAGTRGHRVLTSGGWRHLYELRCGSRVLSSCDSARRGGVQGQAACVAGGRIQEAAGGGGYLGGGAPAEVPDREACLVCLEVSVRGEVRGADSATAPESAFDGLDREPEWGAETGQDGPQGDPPVISGCGVQSSGDGAEVGDERVSDSEESFASWIGSDGAVTSAHAGDGLGNGSSAGHSFPRAYGGGEAISREAEGVLRRPVCRLREACPASLVHPGTLGGLSVSKGPEASPEESCLLEHEQGGAATIDGSSRRGDTPCSPVLHGEVHGGLCLSGGESTGGGGRGIPQGGRGYEMSGRQKGGEDSGTGMGGSAFHDEASRDESWGSGFVYPTAAVVSIESIGEQDVWDIEVEEDHSFIANGFVNHNSCSEPNLQQVSGKKGLVKPMFVPPSGHKLVVGDFNQLQFRLAGHYAKTWFGKSNIADAYLAGMDLHTRTMRELGFDKKYPDPKEARKEAKRVNFSFIFGRGASSFAEENKRPSAEATMFYNGFHKSYPEIRWCSNKCRKDLCEKGYVESILGRRRNFPQHKGKDPNAYEKKEEDGGPRSNLWWDGWVAWNAVVQGAESDLVRIVMRNIYREILERRKADPRWNTVKMLIQVHDEIVYQAPDEIAEDMATLMREKGSNLLTLKIPIILDVGVGVTWEAAKK